MFPPIHLFVSFLFKDLPWNELVAGSKRSCGNNLDYGN